MGKDSRKIKEMGALALLKDDQSTHSFLISFSG
jgi:hypothetical protein